MRHRLVPCAIFFFNDTATTEIYTLSLHDALPISSGSCGEAAGRTVSKKVVLAVIDGLKPSMLERAVAGGRAPALARLMAEGVYVDDCALEHRRVDRKSTRLNSSHLVISYAGFCLK